MGSGKRLLAKAGVLVVTALMVTAVAAPSAGAATGRAVTGPATGTAPFAFNSCALVHQVFKGQITTPHAGIADLDVDVCVDIASQCTATGTFVITKNGGKVTGSSAGTLDCASGLDVKFSFVLHVLHSPKKLATPGQDLHFRGVWHSDGATGGPFEGKVKLK